MFVGRQNPEDIGLPLSQVKDSVPRRSHSRLGIDPLPAATPDHGLQEEWTGGQSLGKMEGTVTKESLGEWL